MARLFWMCLISVTLLQIPADALRCFLCHYDTSLNSTSCETTSENCTADLKFCVTQTVERHDGSKEFSRSCVPAEVCKPDYCKEEVIQLLRRKSCNITCCQENFCNRDDYIPPVGSGHASYAHWLFAQACLIVATWFSLFGRSWLLWLWKNECYFKSETQFREKMSCKPCLTFNLRPLFECHKMC